MSRAQGESKQSAKEATGAEKKQTPTFKMLKSKMIFHSDQGQQYASSSFQKLFVGLGVKQSFSPLGSPHHNAVMESFFGSMKKEELYRKVPFGG